MPKKLLVVVVAIFAVLLGGCTTGSGGNYQGGFNGDAKDNHAH